MNDPLMAILNDDGGPDLGDDITPDPRDADEFAVIRTPEQGHTKACLAAAVICAVENIRDLDHLSDHDFRLSMQENEMLVYADQYLREGLTICKCPLTTKEN